MLKTLKCILENYADFKLRDYDEKNGNFYATIGLDNRVLFFFIFNFSSSYNRVFKAKEKVNKSFSYPHTYVRDEDGYVGYCLLDKDKYILTSLSLKAYLEFHINQLHKLLKLNQQQINLEYQK